MAQPRLIGVGLARIANTPLAMAALIAVNVGFSIVANAAFRVSARGGTWTDVVVWQVVGNLAGFVTVLALTALLHYVPLNVAFPVTTGISVVAVQVAAGWLFQEPIGTTQWVGALLIGLGVLLVQR